MSSDLQSELTQLAHEFDITQEYLQKIIDTFVEQATESLNRTTPDPRALPMIPTYVTGVPTGKETGLYLAADLGGTNFRVCSVLLDGNHGYKMEQKKWPIPHELMTGNSAEFFVFLAAKVQDFLREHHQDHFASENVADSKELKMGFTFSFPINQTSINHGTLIRWTKGFNIKDAVGEDICAALQSAMDKLDLRVHVAALINDTVGALLARTYKNSQDSQTVVGAIFGTGTNAAYYEKIANIKKYKVTPEVTSDSMTINTEWGSFDNNLTILPNTKYDKAIDPTTPNPTMHLFEKRISGYYLGEIHRRVLLEYREKGLIFQGKRKTTEDKLAIPFSSDTSIPSNSESDTSADLSELGKLIEDHFGYETSLEERRAIKQVAHIVARRSAYLSAGAVGGLLKLTRALERFEKVDMGGDGSVFECYPGFQDTLREALKTTSIGKDVDRITFGLGKDGSGIGAALAARMAPDSA